MTLFVIMRLLEPWQTLQTGSGQRIRVPVARQPDYDAGTLFEIFADDDYALPPDAEKLPIETVIDLGVNIGLSVVLFSNRYPEARIIGYEPIPHQLLSALRNTCDLPRVELYGAAACANDQELQFRLMGSSSTVGVAGRNEAVANVRGLDMFKHLEHLGAAGPFLLKMDIEGGEYDLFADPRMDDLLDQTNIAFLELHRFDDESDEKAERIFTKLQEHFRSVRVTRCVGGWATVLVAHR